MDQHDVKTYRFDELYKHQRTPESSIISQGLLKAGALMVVGGAPKTYKSFVLLSIASSLALGRPLFNTYRSPHGRAEPIFTVDRPRKVMLFEQEIGEDDLEDRIIPWFEALPSDLQARFAHNFCSHSLDHALCFDKEGGAKRLEAEIRAFKPEVVIFDPLIEFHSADENSSTMMGAMLKNFMTLCRRTHVTPILSHHEGKEGDNPRAGGDRLRGSSALYGKGDTFINLSITNRPAMRIRVGFTLRRGRPIKDMVIQIDPDTLEARFLCWQGDKNWKKFANPADDTPALGEYEANSTKQ